MLACSRGNRLVAVVFAVEGPYQSRTLPAMFGP
jgi:hypothetical protein